MASQIHPLYTPEERIRRDRSKWTLVQGILAPVQFVIFLVSLYFVIPSLFIVFSRNSFIALTALLSFILPAAGA